MKGWGEENDVAFVLVDEGLDERGGEAFEHGVAVEGEVRKGGLEEIFIDIEVTAEGEGGAHHENTGGDFCGEVEGSRGWGGEGELGPLDFHAVFGGGFGGELGEKGFEGLVGDGEIEGTGFGGDEGTKGMGGGTIDLESGIGGVEGERGGVALDEDGGADDLEVMSAESGWGNFRSGGRVGDGGEVGVGEVEGEFFEVFEGGSLDDELMGDDLVIGKSFEDSDLEICGRVGEIG